MNFASDYNIYMDENSVFYEELVDSVYLKRGLKIEHLASLLNVNTSTIERLNPVYRINFVPFLEDEKFAIILPQGTS